MLQFLYTPLHFWRGFRISSPPSTKKNPNDALCSRDNSLQPDEEIKSLAIIVVEKKRFEKSKVFEFPTLIILVLEDDNLKKYLDL